MFDILKENWNSRGRIVYMATSDLVRSFRGSALGWVWAIVKPTIFMFVLWFAFSIGIRPQRAEGDQTIFFLWLVSGVVPWFYMSSMLTQGSDVVKRYSYLITKMRFPVSVISTFMSLSKYYIHLMLVAVVTVLYFAFGNTFDLYLLQLPVLLILIFLFFTAWSIMTAPLSAISKDFANAIKAAVQPLFWLSGIMWSLDDVGIPWLETALKFNPITFFAQGYRSVFADKQWLWEDPASLGIFLVTFVVVMVLASYFHNRLRKEIPDVL